MRNILLFITGFLALGAIGQDKMLTLNDAIINFSLYPSSIYQQQWVPGTELISMLEITDDKQQLIAFVDAKTAEKSELKISLADINFALTNAKKDTMTRLPYPNWIDAENFGFPHNGEFLMYNINKKSVKKRFAMDATAKEVVYTDAFTGYAGVIENGFAYEVNNRYGHVKSPNEGIVIGQSVHRNEFGITNGLFLSPDGSKLAYYYMDERMVTQYPLYNLSGTPATADQLRYPTAGKTSHEVSVRVKTIGGSEADIQLNVSGAADQYLTNISWTPDNKYILIAVVNREQNHMWLNKYDAVTGAYLQTLFEEKHEKYVEPEHPAHFVNNKQFIWWSERDGYNHLYLYNSDGSLAKQLTKGEWIVTDFHGMSENGKQVFISGTKDSPLERHLYCVDVESGKIKKLTSGSGVHNIIASPNLKMFIDNFSSPAVPRKITVINSEGKDLSTLHIAENPLADYKPVEMEIGRIKGIGGEDLYYRVFKPADFDSKKKYPAIVYLYNGPHLQLITNSWNGGANHWFNYMAQQGFVVYSIDGRGSANRGLAFENAIFRHAGLAEMEDQLMGLQWLKSQSYVDSSRVGIHGWSYGGYMTISLMTRTPGRYKVGVAGGPVIDWKLYEVMYTERYMDTPEENPEGYQATDLKNYVKNLEGKLLVIHGAQDNVVLWEHSLEYLETAIKKGVQLDYFVYPHHEHNVRGVDRVHLYTKISQYFLDNL